MSVNYQLEIGKILGICMVFVKGDQLEKIIERLYNFKKKPDVFWATIEILVPEKEVRELIKPIVEKLATSEEKAFSKPIIQPQKASEYQALKLAETSKAYLYIVKTKKGWESIWTPKSLVTSYFNSDWDYKGRTYAVHDVEFEEWFMSQHGIEKALIDKGTYSPIKVIIDKSKSEFKKRVKNKRSKFASTQGRPD